ncbi:class I SAM-dependent methyltransferase [Rhodococcoides fascians]|uniref:class I SAM-dependent methyltransferase n=1 Tax=Rhodococcoides fascians TaxID=1828 RepID=UPI00056A4E57|nr:MULTISPECIES: class I SAM-dependent methyltransferase [Rhodococcus]
MGHRLRRVNSRHPWNHNDFFHSWILAKLPDRRVAALDIGCGQGGLALRLAQHFESVVGTELDPTARTSAENAARELDNVIVCDRQMDSWPDDSVDLVTMVASLHHLDVAAALGEAKRILAPGGRLLVVGLAPPRSIRDFAWDAVSTVTNPVIGFVHHPWPSHDGVTLPPFPVKDPELSFDDLQSLAKKTLPGSVMRHRVGFRHTLEWTKPR